MKILALVLSLIEFIMIEYPLEIIDVETFTVFYPFFSNKY